MNRTTPYVGGSTQILEIAVFVCSEGERRDPTSREDAWHPPKQPIALLVSVVLPAPCKQSMQAKYGRKVCKQNMQANYASRVPKISIQANYAINV